MSVSHGDFGVGAIVALDTGSVTSDTDSAEWIVCVGGTYNCNVTCNQNGASGSGRAILKKIAISDGSTSTISTTSTVTNGGTVTSNSDNVTLAAGDKLFVQADEVDLGATIRASAEIGIDANSAGVSVMFQHPADDGSSSGTYGDMIGCQNDDGQVLEA